MTPPKNRRPGYSRKAQYSIFTAYLAAMLGALAGVLLLVLSYVDPLAFSVLRGGAADATAPIGRFFAASRVGVQNISHETIAYWDAGSRNAELQREVDATRTALIEAQALKQENLRLKQVLGLVESQKPVAVGRLINSTSSSSKRLATIGVGFNQGVRSGQPVRSPKGLIGRILTVGATTATILLITDSDNVIPVKRTRDSVVAFAQGRSDGRLDIRLIDIGVNPFKPGDVMVTSGSGGLYSPNIPVAIVESKSKDGAIARILSNPASTDFVVVEPVYQEELVKRLQAEPAATAVEP